MRDLLNDLPNISFFKENEASNKLTQIKKLTFFSSSNELRVSIANSTLFSDFEEIWNCAK